MLHIEAKYNPLGLRLIGHNRTISNDPAGKTLLFPVEMNAVGVEPKGLTDLRQ